MTEKKKPDGMTVQIILSTAVVILGALLLFVDQISVELICYAFCTILIVSAIVSIIKYFVSEAYKELHDYHFAIGITLLIIGICGLVGVTAFIEHFNMYLGLVSLVLGTTVLQSTVQLKLINNRLWIAGAVFSVIILLGVVPVLANLVMILDNIYNYTYWMFMISGGLSLVSLLITWTVFRSCRKNTSELSADSDENYDKNTPKETAE